MHVCRVNWVVKLSVWACFKSRLKAYLSPRFGVFAGTFLLWPPRIRWQPLRRSWWRPWQLQRQSAKEGPHLRAEDILHSEQRIHLSRYWAALSRSSLLVVHSQQSATELLALPDIILNRADDYILILIKFYTHGRSHQSHFSAGRLSWGNCTGFAILKTFVSHPKGVFSSTHGNTVIHWIKSRTT